MRSEHIGKRWTDADERVLLCLAEKGPRTGYDLFRKDRIISSSTWHETHERLGSRVLIEEMDYLRSGIGHARGAEEYEAAKRRYSELQAEKSRSRPYWLTSIGIGEALRLGADPRRMLSIMNEHSIDDEVSRMILDVAIEGGRDWASKVFDEHVAEGLGDGFWTVKLPKDRMDQLRILGAIRVHPKAARAIGEQFMRESEFNREMGQLFLSEEAWKAETERRQREARRPTNVLMKRLRESNGALSKSEAMEVLAKRGTSEKEAQSAIRTLLSVGLIYESKPGFFRPIG